MRNSITVLFLFCAFSTCAMENESVKKHQTENLETIIVTGDRPLYHYRNAMYDAQEAFFDTYNKLVKDKRYQIACGQKRRHAFTRVKQRVCEPLYVGDIEYKSTQGTISTVLRRDLLNGKIGNVPNDAELRRASAKEFKKQMADLQKLLAESEELREMYEAMVKAQLAYERVKGSI